MCTLDSALVSTHEERIMAGKRLRQNGTWEYVFKRKGVLDGPIYFTFDSEEEGIVMRLKPNPCWPKVLCPLRCLKAL